MLLNMQRPVADEENEKDLKKGVKVSDDISDLDLKSAAGGSQNMDSDDSEEESSEDEGPKWGGEEASDHEEEDEMPTLTASMTSNQFKYVARCALGQLLLACTRMCLERLSKSVSASARVCARAVAEWHVYASLDAQCRADACERSALCEMIR